MRGFGVSSIAIACVLLRTAAADDTDPKQQRAKQLFEQGRAELEAAGDDKAKIASACDKFAESIKLDPEAAGTMLNLGLCNEKLDKYKSALYWFRRAQARAAETGLAAAEEAAKTHTVDLASKVATVRITFSTPPPEETRVKIDDDEIAPADYLRAEVDPGHHTLVVGAPGHKVFTQEFDVEGRGGQTLQVELVAGSSSIIVDRGAGRRRAAIYLAIGGSVLWATAGGLSLWAKGKYNDYAKDKMPITGQTDGGKFCSPTGCTRDEAIEAANHYQAIAHWGASSIFVAGSLAIGGAIILYVSAPEKERIDQTVFAPVVTSDQLGFAVRRSF